MPRPLDQQPAVPSFGTAVAQWQLALRTEVKRASSLPTSMFDACDPMLETRLAETAEAMLACLQEPDATITQPTHPGEKRLEQVATAELSALPARLHRTADEPPVDVDDHLSAEYLGVLTDTCGTAEGAPRHGAAQLLVRDFGITPTADLERCTRELASSLLGATSQANLDAICHRIAAAVAVAVAGADPGAGPDPEQGAGR